MKNKKTFQELAVEFKYSSCRKEYERAFKALYNALEPVMLRYLYSFTKNNDDSKEVFVLAMTKVSQNISMYDEVKNAFSTWVYTVVKYEAMQYVERARRTNDVCYLDIVYTIDDVKERDDDSDIYSKLLSTNKDRLAIEVDFENFIFSNKNEYDDITNKKYEIALQCINDLPEKYRNLIIDKYVNNIKQTELEERYDMNLNTIKTRSRKAVDLLNELYRIRTKRIYDLV
jgi:RNA polymerase sigma factor (sigma-70 family)